MATTYTSRRTRRQHLNLGDRADLQDDDLDDLYGRYASVGDKLDTALNLLWASCASLVVGGLLLGLNLIINGRVPHP